MTDQKKKWIQSMDMQPGALHKQMGIPEGQKIPIEKLHEAMHSDNPLLRKRAALAMTLRKMHK